MEVEETYGSFGLWIQIEHQSLSDTRGAAEDRVIPNLLLDTRRLRNAPLSRFVVLLERIQAPLVA